MSTASIGMGLVPGFQCSVSHDGLRVDFTLDRTGAMKWLLIARNGRVIAMSPGGEPDAPACVKALGQVCADASLNAQVTHPGSSVVWVWSAVGTDGRVVAVSGRPYARYGTCMSAGSRFLSVARGLRGADLELLTRRPICPE